MENAAQNSYVVSSFIPSLNNTVFPTTNLSFFLEPKRVCVHKDTEYKVDIKYT